MPGDMRDEYNIYADYGYEGVAAGTQRSSDSAAWAI